MRQAQDVVGPLQGQPNGILPHLIKHLQQHLSEAAVDLQLVTSQVQEALYLSA